MIAIPVSVLCNKDQRSDEEIREEELLKDLGISKETNSSSTSEWRESVLFLNQVEAMYPNASDITHTVVHMASGSCITIKESIEEIKSTLSQITNQTYGQHQYYSSTSHFPIS